MPLLSTLRGLHVVCPGEIPGELANLVNLRDLNLEENQLSGKAPAWMADVEYLRLQNNQFECGEEVDRTNVYWPRPC